MASESRKEEALDAAKVGEEIFYGAVSSKDGDGQAGAAGGEGEMHPEREHADMLARLKRDLEPYGFKAVPEKQKLQLFYCKLCSNLEAHGQREHVEEEVCKVEYNEMEKGFQFILKNDH